MATTTNYSWTTPDDTDLVKDGAAAIRTLGSSADTTVKALNPGTTAGDIDYYTTSTAKARVAIGTAGQVLTVNSGATAPEWATISAGGMTLLSTTSLTGASTTISNISQSYNSLFFVMYGVTAAGNGNMRVQPNGSSSTSSVVHARADGSSASTSTSLATNLDFSPIGWDGTNANNVVSVRIDNYTSSSNYKTVNMYGYARNANGNETTFVSGGAIISNTAITSLVFSQAGGNLSTGTVLLYGVK